MLDLTHILTLLPAFAVVLTRVSGLMLTAPLFSLSVIPPQVKAGLAALISLIVFPIVRPTMGALPDNLLSLTIACSGELMVGLVIGLAVNLLMTGVQLAAQMASQQMGLGLARVFNPALGAQSDVMEQFYVMFATVLFLLLNGHLLVLGAVLDSFKSLPPLAVTVRPEAFEVLVGLLGGAYVMALKVAAPTLVVFFLVSAVMGFLGRTVPQINILVVGFPVRITVGLAVLATTVGTTALVFSDGYRETVDAVGELIRGLGA
jgi:flagellar biosynthetic protein FliR